MGQVHFRGGFRSRGQRTDAFFVRPAVSYSSAGFRESYPEGRLAPNMSLHRACRLAWNHSCSVV